jgi:hypothetical protein
MNVILLYWIGVSQAGWGCREGKFLRLNIASLEDDEHSRQGEDSLRFSLATSKC